MRLFILGKNNDDKGTQLEQLTARIMEFQGFTNINMNIQEAGGNEVDVLAEKQECVGVKNSKIEVIAECKAHKQPIDMNDWLKFIGKFHYAKQRNPRIFGLMVCLSGATGAVVGTYKEKHAIDDSVQLIANADLIQLLSQCYNLQLNTILRRNMSIYYGEVSEMNLLYYNKQMYWLVAFVDGNYTIATAEGSSVCCENLDELLPMVQQYTEYSQQSYINIEEYQKAKYYVWSINIALLTELVSGVQGDIQYVLAHLVQSNNIQDGLSLQDLEHAIESNPFVEYDKQSSKINMIAPEKINFIQFYQYVLQYGCPTQLFVSAYFQRYIDNDLLTNIFEIQHGLEVTKDKRDDILFLIKHSPQALNYAIHEHPIFDSYDMAKTLPSNICELYSDIFYRQLLELFASDFYNPQMYQIYYNYFELTNLSFESIIRVVEKGQIKEFRMKSNSGLYKLQDSNQIVLAEGLAKDDDKNE